MPRKNCNGVDLSKLSPEEAAAVHWFAAELRKIREEETRLMRIQVVEYLALISEGMHQLNAELSANGQGFNVLTRP
jgi:hypothetical protein